MIPVYEEVKDSLWIFKDRCKHVPPHLHKSVECVYVLEGTLELGVGQELYHMETGDFAIVFPELIHHYQAFDRNRSKACYLLAQPSLSGSYFSELQKKCPKAPVIKKEDIHPDIIYAIKALLKDKSNNTVIKQAFFQIILARSLMHFELIDKTEVSSEDIVYQVVSYISRNFKESLSLPDMAKDLGTNKSALSKVFSGTFHRNFNQYLNETRLDHACALLEYGNLPIIEVAMDSGFESLRTFNRVFRERFKKTPSEYREECKFGVDRCLGCS